MTAVGLESGSTCLFTVLVLFLFGGANDAVCKENIVLLKELL